MTMQPDQDDSIVDLAQVKASISETARLSAQGSATLADIIAAQSEIARAGLDPKKVVDVITRRSQALTDSNGAVVEMIDGSELVYWSASGSVTGHLGLRMPIDNSLSGLCVRKGELLRCNDSETDPRVNLDACRRVGLRSALVLPLLCDGRLVGVLKVLSDQPNAYTRRHMDVLRTMGTFMGATLHHSLENARMLKSIADARDGDAMAHGFDALQREHLWQLIQGRRIQPVFQPIVELTSGTVIGWEGLSRFPRDLPEPDDGWFAAASRLGLCPELETACIAAIVSAAAHMPEQAPYVSINVSPETLVRLDLDGLIPQADPRRWVFEITEHSEVRDYQRLADRVKSLQAAGWRIAVDDAGAGYSSLRHVLRLSPDIVKLDISLTRDIDTDIKHRQLTTAIVSFCRDTGMVLVAEGIETAAERDALVELGVVCGQGYLLGRPAPLRTSGP
jgi:EAL domain-containing protein (putative c-di-GMP-specific phosphodiesterase class I)